MIDWLLSNYQSMIRASRWILAGCAFSLMGIASLPHNALDRIIGIIGIAIIAAIFLVWLGLVLLEVVHPRLLQDMRRKRAEAAALRLDRDLNDW